MQIEQYQKLNTFSRRICFNQVIAYSFILFLNISFWLLIQNHFVNQNYRFALIVLFSMSLMILILVGVITSYLDPSDPMMRELKSNSSTKYLVSYKVLNAICKTACFANIAAVMFWYLPVTARYAIGIFKLIKMCASIRSSLHLDK